MREMLNLRQEIINFEKKREKLTSETTKTMKGTIAETRKEQTNELNENKVKVDELRENMLSMEDITKQKVIAESTLIQWQEYCHKKQEEITQAKYEI